MSSSSSPPNNTPERKCSGENSSSPTAAAVATPRDVDVVTPARNDDDDRVDGSSRNDYSVNNEEEKFTEIKDLQRALEYLISDKRQSSLISNNDDQEKTEKSSVTSSAIAQHSNKSGVDANDETLCQIPNLVNRILVEHYSSLPPGQSHKRRDIPFPAVREKMTQLIIAVIVEFAEPYFVRKIGRREEERSELLAHGKGEQEPQKKKSKRRKGVEEDAVVISSTFRFEDRAVSWATQCLKLLLQPSLSPSKGVKNDLHIPEKNDLYIPELDALLAATGSNDGNEIEQRMQQSLLLGMQARSTCSCLATSRWHSKKTEVGGPQK